MIEKWMKRMERAWHWAQWIAFYYRLTPAQRRKLLGKNRQGKVGMV